MTCPHTIEIDPGSEGISTIITFLQPSSSAKVIEADQAIAGDGPAVTMDVELTTQCAMAIFSFQSMAP